MSTTFYKGPEILLTKPFIVVGVDGSPCSKQALRWALGEAQRSNSVVDVVHAWVDPWAIGGAPSLVGDGRQGVARMRGELAEIVESAVIELGAHDLTVVEQVLVGDPVDVLANESRSATMLVVGTSGLGRVGRRALGSVSQQCAKVATVPLVLVPEPATEHPRREPRPELVHVA